MYVDGSVATNFFCSFIFICFNKGKVHAQYTALCVHDLATHLPCIESPKSLVQIERETMCALCPGIRACNLFSGLLGY